MKVNADRETCIGSGQCVFVAGGVFDQSESDGKVIVLKDRPEAALTERVQMAYELCPVHAISVSEE